MEGVQSSSYLTNILRRRMVGNSKPRGFDSLQKLSCLLCLLLAGCWSPSDSLDPAPINQDATAETTSASTDDRTLVPGLDTHPSRQGLEKFYQRVDPASDDWQSEALRKQVSRQLNALGKMLTQPKQRSVSNIGEIVSPNFVGSRFTSKIRESVYNNGSLTVHREDEGKDIPGVDAFANSLRNLAQRLQAVGEARVKFKITEVHVENGQVRTKALFQAIASGTEGDRQINATWISRWELISASDLRLLNLAVEEYEEITRNGSGGIHLADCTEAVFKNNVTFDQQLRRSINDWRGHLPVGLGIGVASWQGLAVGDVDGDGLDDVYVLQPGGLPNALFVHQPDGTVIDRARAMGVDWLEACQSALIVDLDNDGDQDLCVAMGLGILILTNDKGRFVLQSRNAIVTLSSSASMSAADYDNDGDLDLFICGYNDRNNVTGETQIGFPIPFHDANNGGPNRLLRNDGRMRFSDATEQAGLNANNRRFSLAAAWEDFDNDGDQDLYIANDFGRNNLYRNDGGKFVDVAAELGVEDISAGMSVTWADLNNDGWMDLYVSNMFSSAGNRIAFQRRFKQEANQATRTTIQRHARGNSLFENVEGKSFQDVSLRAGVTMGRWAWGSLAADLNNDGWQDLLVANGFVTGDDSGDL